MINKKLVIIFILLLNFILFISFSNLNYTFSILIISKEPNINIPSYLKEDYLTAKLKWLKKLVLVEPQIEKIKRVNKDSFEPLKDIITTDFFILIELYSENIVARIHFYSIIHNIYCGNFLINLNDPQIVLNTLNLIHNSTIKLSESYEKKDFNNVINVIFTNYTDEKGKDIFIIPDKAPDLFLTLSLFLNFSSNPKIAKYYQDLSQSKDLAETQESISINLILFKIAEKLTKILLIKNYYEKIVISSIGFYLIKESYVKNAISELLKMKLTSLEYNLLSFILLN